MKNMLFKTLRVIYLIAFFPLFSQAQVSSVVSSNGYIVQLNILPTAIIPSTMSCTWGYNYNVKVSYNVKFTGSNIPASLYTLQGTIGCGSNTNFFDLPNNGGVGTVNSTSNPWVGTATCATASVTNLNCNNAKIQISGPGIASQTVSFPITYSTLPVELTSFKAGIENDRVRIDWTTATEINNNEFDIERSLTGNAWQQIKSIPGAGNSTEIKTYQTFDDHPYPGVNYYRLKQVDIDGKKTYSEVRSVKYEAIKSAPSLYPIPNTGHTVHIRNISNYQDYQLVFKNMSGAVIYKTTLDNDTIQLPNMKSGIYVVEVTNLKTDTTRYLRYIQI